LCAFINFFETNPSSHLSKLLDPFLSLVLIAKNEASFIARCLDSAKGVASEMIVVDTGSTDETSDIAQSCGARVLNFKWCDDFSAARNEGLEAARGRWILVLDADEYLPEASINALQALIAGPADRAYHLLNKSSSDGGKTGMVGKIVRLFPNRPEIRFEWPVHEQVVTSLNRAGVPIHDTSIEIIHTGYSSPEVNAAKQERNLRILEKATANDPDPHPMALFLQGGALLDLGRISEALEFYKRCADSPAAAGGLGHGARVRMATCLAALKRPADILTLLPPEPPADWHPEMLLHVGEALIQTDRTEEGLNFLSLGLASENRALIPAYDPVRVKARCAMAMAGAFEKSNIQLAVGLLKLAAASIQQGREITPADLEALQGPA
jgi:tetratricopeptide (TPR) repeat protein